MIITGAELLEKLRKSWSYLSKLLWVPASNNTVWLLSMVVASGVSKFPRSHTPTTLTPYSLRRLVSCSCLPTKGVPCTVASAINTSPKEPITWVLLSVQEILRARKLPICLAKRMTWFAPANSMMSSELGLLQVPTMGR